MANDDRERPFSVRPAKGGRDKIVQIAKANGKSINALFLDAVFGSATGENHSQSKLDTQAIVRLQAQVARIQDGLQAARKEPSVLPSAIERCENELIEIRNFLMYAIGRSP